MNDFLRIIAVMLPVTLNGLLLSFLKKKLLQKARCITVRF